MKHLLTVIFLVTSVSVHAESTKKAAGKEKSSNATQLEKLRGACLEVMEGVDKNRIPLQCDCVVRYHKKNSSPESVNLIIDAITGKRKFDTPEISDPDSIVLNGNADVMETCEKTPAWDPK